MTRITRLTLAAVLALSSLLAVGSPAHAAGDDAAAARAASWIAASTPSDVGVAADALLALAAAGGADQADAADSFLAFVKADAATYAGTDPAAAAKLLLVAEAYGEDGESFGGVDLVAAVEDGIAEDGSFGSWPGPFSTGMGAVALSRADAEVPEAMITYLLTYQNADGGYGFAPGGTSDADSTGMALLALTAVPSTESEDAVAHAIAWATSNQAEDGSWAGFNPVNSTAVLGSALGAAGTETTSAVQYLVTQQADSGAFLNDGKEDLLATSQAALLLADSSYLDATWDPTRTAAPATPAAPEATQTTGSGAPSGIWVGAAVVIVVLAGGGIWLARRAR